jgi:hypothetical protein
VADRADAALGIRGSPPFAGWAQGEIQAILGDINTYEDWGSGHGTLLSSMARPCGCGLRGPTQLFGLCEWWDVTTRATGRSQRTEGETVCHVRVCEMLDHDSIPFPDTTVKIQGWPGRWGSSHPPSLAGRRRCTSDLTFQGIHNPGACHAQPRHNQVTDQIGDYCTLSTRHPDWFLLGLPRASFCYQPRPITALEEFPEGLQDGQGGQRELEELYTSGSTTPSGSMRRWATVPLETYQIPG